VSSLLPRFTQEEVRIMYMRRILEVGKAANGYVVECRVPFKPTKSKDLFCEASGEKQFIAKDLDEVSVLVGKLMPMLDDDYSDEKEFDKAFADAVE
jgi:hypothetical protein